VNDGKIAAVDREREGISFSEITIPAKRAADAEARDQVEQEFFRWRETEMKTRLEKTLRKVGD